MANPKVGQSKIEVLTPRVAQLEEKQHRYVSTMTRIGTLEKDLGNLEVTMLTAMGIAQAQIGLLSRPWWRKLFNLRTRQRRP